MTKLKVTTLDRLTVTALQRLKLAATLDYIDPESDLSGVEAVIVRSKVKVRGDFWDRFKNLKLIVTATSGFDHIDIAEAKAHGIRVAFCPEGNVHSAAELTLLLALTLARGADKARALLKTGRWERHEMPGTELYGKTWGILGLGRIGRKVARMARALGMDVMACDPYVDDGIFREYAVERAGLSELYTGADILSLHVPLTAKTRHIVNLRTMEHMKSHVLLINTARGDVVHEADLIEGLRRRMIAGFALDVFHEEPLNPRSALLGLDNVVLTPHIGAHTQEALERSCHLAVDKVIDFSEGKAVKGDPFEESWIKEEDGCLE